MRVRRQVLGDAHVDRASRNQSDLDARFQQLITEAAWGTLWADDTLDQRTRSLITIAILASLGRSEELALHLRASRNTGASPEEIAEALNHVAIYAGVPAANAAYRLAREELGGDATPDQSNPSPEPETGE